MLTMVVFTSYIVSILTTAFAVPNGRDRFYAELVDKASILPAAYNDVELCRYLSKEINMLDVTPNAALQNMVGRSMNLLTGTYHYNIFAETFHKCDFTPDNRFIVPDSYRVEAIYDRKIDKVVEMKGEEHASSEGSSDGGSIGASGRGVKGSLSVTHSKLKSKTTKNNETCISMSVVNKMYIITIDRATKFSSHFEYQLESIKQAINQKLFVKARYLTQALLSDYGTEVTTRAYVGSKITFKSFVKSSFVKTDESKQTEIKLSASYEKKGQGKVEGGISGKFGSSKSNSNEKSSMSTTIYLQGGGGIEVLKNDSLSGFLHDDIPVAIDTETMPIYMFLLDGSVQNMTNENLLRLRMMFEDATNEIVERNTIFGCTDSNYANFDFQANVNDNTCWGNYCTYNNATSQCTLEHLTAKTLATWSMDKFIICMSEKNYEKINGTIMEKTCQNLPSKWETVKRVGGGVFQTCTLSPITQKFDSEFEKIGHSRDNLCKKFKTPNIVNNGYSCPSYTEKQQILTYIHTLPDTIFSKRKTVCSNGIHGCNSTEIKLTIKDKVNITTYWCGPSNKDNFYSAVYFKGYFDPGQVNNYNGQSACSEDMIEIRLFHGTSLCVHTIEQNNDNTKAELTRLFSENDNNPYCREMQSKQLITVVDGKKIYACILKKHAYYNLNVPQLIVGPYLKKNILDERFTQNMLELTFNNNFTIKKPLDEINNNIADYLQRRFRLFKKIK